MATFVESLPATRAIEIVRPVRERLWLAGELVSGEHAPVDPSGA
jgi:hypothetical protein